MTTVKCAGIPSNSETDGFCWGQKNSSIFLLYSSRSLAFWPVRISHLPGVPKACAPSFMTELSAPTAREMKTVHYITNYEENVKNGIIGTVRFVLTSLLPWIFVGSISRHGTARPRSLGRNRAASEDQDREYAKHRLGYLASIIDMRPRYRISRPRASPDIQPYGSACASTLHDCNIMSISCKAISRLPLMEEEGACLKRRIGEPVQLKRIYRYLPFTRSSRGLLMMVRIQISSTVTYLLPVRQR